MSKQDAGDSPVRWGVLGASRFALMAAIPAMRGAPLVALRALASRSLDKARQAAAVAGAPRAYGSYEELLADPDIEAVYNPLPNNLHVPWSIKAARAGKHVLCEKPIAMTAAQADIQSAVANMQVIDAVFRAAESQRWEAI